MLSYLPKFEQDYVMDKVRCNFSQQEWGASWHHRTYPLYSKCYYSQSLATLWKASTNNNQKLKSKEDLKYNQKLLKMATTIPVIIGKKTRDTILTRLKYILMEV
jgi:hypothetical protein